MANPPPDDRTPVAVAAAWSATITTVSMEMVVPILMGYGLDYWLGTPRVFLILGAVFGMALGMWHLVKIVSAVNQQGRRDNGPQPPPSI